MVVVGVVLVQLLLVLQPAGTGPAAAHPVPRPGRMSSSVMMRSSGNTLRHRLIYPRTDFTQQTRSLSLLAEVL